MTLKIISDKAKTFTFTYYFCDQATAQVAGHALLGYMTGTYCQYYWELALREARKVEPGWSPRRGGYMFDSFPKRPKYMKRAKYYKHYQKFVNYTKKGDSFWLNGLSSLR